MTCIMGTKFRLHRPHKLRAMFVDHAFELGLSVYPNPTSDIVYIDGNYTQLNVIVYDVLGKQLMNKSIKNSIDISHLGNGVYILQLSDGVKLTTLRIIKN